MKVYYWTPYMSKVGTIKATINSAISLRKLGYDVKLYKSYREWEGYEDILQKNQIEIIDLGLGKYFHNLSTKGIGYRFSMILISIYSFGKLKENFEQDRPDIVISNLLGYLPLLVRKHSKYKPKIISSIQGKPYFHNFRKILWKYLYAKSDKIITLTEKTKHEMVENLNFPEEKFVVLSNPIIDDSMDELMKSSLKEKQMETKKMIMGIGRMTRQKNFETLIRAFAKVRQQVDCRLVILGEGEEEKRLRELVDELKLTEDVYMPGFVKNPFAFLARTDVFVLSSLWEDAGHALVEAAYCKAPIVSTRCPYGQEEFLEFGKAGELCEIQNADEMAQCILKVLKDNKNQERMKKVQLAYENAMNYHISKHGENLSRVIKAM